MAPSRLVTTGMGRSSIAAELGWLAVFLLLLVVLEAAFLRLLVPHHFNDRIAAMLAGLLAGLIWIAIRARTRSGAPRS